MIAGIKEGFMKTIIPVVRVIKCRINDCNYSMDEHFRDGNDAGYGTLFLKL